MAPVRARRWARNGTSDWSFGESPSVLPCVVQPETTDKVNNRIGDERRILRRFTMPRDRILISQWRAPPTILRGMCVCALYGFHTYTQSCVHTYVHAYACPMHAARTHTRTTCVLRTGQEDGYRSQRESTAGVRYLRADSGPCYRGRSVLSSRSGLYLSSPRPSRPHSYPFSSFLPRDFLSHAANLSIRVASTTR